MTLRMEYAARTHRGRVRKRNEDSFYIPDGKGLDGLVVVADGMGGYNAGDVASSLGVQVACNIIAAARALSPAPTAESSRRHFTGTSTRPAITLLGRTPGSERTTRT